jgi:hypothetical protein
MAKISIAIPFSGSRKGVVRMHGRLEKVGTVTTDVEAGIVLMLTSLVVSRTGDWLRDLLDPTRRGK